MDDAVRLLDAYLDAEWAAVVAVHIELDDAVVAERRAAADAFTRPAPGTLLGVTVDRPPGLGVAVLAGQLEQFGRRRLFCVKEHAHPLWGRLFAGYAGSRARDAAGNYERLYYVAETDDGPRIVSEYVPELLTPAVEWTHFGGVVIDEPGPVVGVRKLEAPSRRRDRRDWEAS